MKSYFYLWLDQEILLEIIKIYYFEFILWNSAFIYDCIENGILLKIIKIYHFKFILWNHIFIYDCIENGILLETIKNIISNLHYYILLLSMTRSRMGFY